MARFKQFHDPELSIWQAAVGEVEAEAAAGTQTLDVGAPQVAISRPDEMDDMSAEAAAYCAQVDTGTPIAQATAVHPSTEGLLQTAGFCSLTALKIAKAKILGNIQPRNNIRMSLPSLGIAILNTPWPRPSTPNTLSPSKSRSPISTIRT